MTEFRYDTWERWVGAPTPPNQRRGQFLWNNAPVHITATFKSDEWDDSFDPFFAEREDDIRCQRFMLFAYIMWDEKTPTEDDVQAARDMVVEITS